MALILTQAQARAVYNALRELNSIGCRGASLHIDGLGRHIGIMEALDTREILIITGRWTKTPCGGQISMDEEERHVSQYEFANRYGLIQA